MWLALSPPDESVTSVDSGRARMSSYKTSTLGSSKCFGMYIAFLANAAAAELRSAGPATPVARGDNGHQARAPETTSAHSPIVRATVLDRDYRLSTARCRV